MSKSREFFAKEDMVARAAWLHFGAGYTQRKVGEILGVSAVHVHRLIGRALEEGAIQVTVSGEVGECIRLEEKITERFGLLSCRVMPDLREADLPLHALSHGGVELFKELLASDTPITIGLSSGRSVAAAIDKMPQIRSEGSRVVTLTGAPQHQLADTSQETAYRLADKTGAEVYIIPAPGYVAEVGDRDTFLRQPGVKTSLEVAAEADFLVIGIGAAETAATNSAISKVDYEELLKRGAVGEILSYFFDESGKLVDALINQKALSVELEKVEKSCVAAIAGGEGKAPAILSVLRSGLISKLVTDEPTATQLVALSEVNEEKVHRLKSKS